MGVVIRQSFWTSLMMYAGVVIGYINTLVLLPKYLEFDQIGLIRLIQSNATMLIPVAVLGMNGSVVKYFPSFRNNQDTKNSIITLHLTILLVSNLLIASLAYLFIDQIVLFFVEKSAAYIDYIFITILILSFQSFFEYLFSISRSNLNIIFPSFLKEVVLRLASLVLVLLYGLEKIGFGQFIVFLCGFYMLNTVLFISYLIVKKHFALNYHFQSIEKKLLKELVNYSGYTLLTSIGISIIANISYLMTSKFLGLEANGIFTTCMFIGIIIEMPKRAMSFIVGPLVSDTFKKNDINQIEHIYQRASLNLGIIGMLITIGVITNLDDFFLMVSKGEQIALGYWVIIGVGCAKLISMIFGPSGELLLFSQLKNFMLYLMMLSAFFIVVLNWLLIPSLGLNGAAIAFFLTTFSDQLFRFILIKTRLKIRLFVKQHILLILIGISTAFIISSIPFYINPLLNILIRSIITSVIFLGLIYIFKVSEEINFTINKILARIFKNA